MRRVMVAFVLGVIMLGWGMAGQSYGKEFPTRPVELIVPYTPGSTMDLLARLIANTAPKYLGQPVLVVNKPGAGGSMAAADVIVSNPDGHKLMVTTNFFFSMTTKTQKVPFNPNDLVPVANFLEYRNGFIVKGDSPWKTFNDVVDYARKNPGKLRWSHTGRGISQHMYGLLVFRKANVETTDIPYKGSPEMLSALLGGHIDGSFMVYGVVSEQVRSGAVRYLVTVGERRYSNLPNVPCAGELGFKDTPAEIKKTLLEAMTKTYQDPEFKKGFEALGEEPKFGGPDFMAEAIRNSESVAVPILKEFGLYVGGK
jgi:tripartite-type tricarboxylate transporter receptor subunit TctC